MEKKELIRLIYLYLFSAVGLILIIIGSVKLIDLFLTTYIFKKADMSYFYPVVKPLDVKMTDEEWERQREEQKRIEEENRRSEKQRKISNSIAMLIVGAPLFLYHWRILRKEK